MPKKKSKDRSSVSSPLSIELSWVTLRNSREMPVTAATLSDSASSILMPSKPIACVGIDPGLSQLTMTVLPVTPKGKCDSAYVYAFKTKGEKGDDWSVRYYRIDLLCRAVDNVLSGLEDFVGRHFAAHIGVEGYAFGLRGNAVQTMAEIRQGLLDVVMPYVQDRFFNVYVLPIPTWKSALCPGLKKVGMSQKEAVQECIIRRWPATKEAFGKDHNKFDSFGIADVLYQAFYRPDISNPSLDRFRDREGIRRQDGQA